MNTKKSAKVEVAKPAAAKPVAAKPVSAKPVAAKPLVKPAKAVKPAPVKTAPVEVKVKSVKAAKEPKVAKKPKVVRDSFTMPQSEYQNIAKIKELGLKAGLQVKKSEVLRAGVLALCAMSDAQLKTALSSLDKIKTGRPNKH